MTLSTNSIRQLRFDPGGMTQQDLARRIGLTRQAAFRMAAAFAVPLDQVFQYHPESLGQSPRLHVRRRIHMGSKRKKVRSSRGATAPAASAAASVGEFSSPACYLHEFESHAPGSAPGIALKRIQEACSASDGFRVLVDRLWPRGISKARAALDEWRPDLAPSTALRQWYHRDLDRWGEFRRRYRAELAAHPGALVALRERAARQRVTLLYGARDRQRNHALVLREVLQKDARTRARRADNAQA